MNIEITFKTLTIFALGACAGMILLALSMGYYGDTRVSDTMIWQTASYFVIVSIFGYIGVGYESIKQREKEQP